MASSNVLDLCRLCGTDTLSIVRHNIFDDEGQMKKFAEKISNCLPVNVTEEDPLPKIMCGECAYKLDFLSEFREKSVKTESALMALIKKNIKHEVIDTEEQNEGRVILSSTRHSTRRAAKTRYFVESESEDATHQTDDDFHGDDSYRDDEDEDSEIAEPPKKKERRSLRTRTPRKKKKSLQEEAIPENEENTENPLKILDLACQEVLVKQQKRVSSRKTKQRNPEPEPPADPMKIEVLDVRSLPHFSAEPSLQPDKIEEFNNPITSRADFTCAQCHIKFKNYGSYVAHSKKPHKHHCKACNKNFINARGEHACAFKCDQCDFRYFKTNHHLKSHIKKFHSGLEFVCNDCGTKCPTKLLMKVHYVKVHIKKHTEDHRFKATWCHECKRSFSSTFVLQHHKLRVHDGLILCCFCLATFPSKEERKKHVKEVHESKKDKPHFDCPECGKQLSSRAMVQIHVDNIHKKLRPHLCQVCGSSFALASHLKLHIMMHTGEKKHVCEVCGHAFARIENLTQHKRIHSDVRPYHCDFCSMKFKQASSLKSHRRIHTGERPYKCNLCPSSFRCKPQLNRHVKFHPA